MHNINAWAHTLNANWHIYPHGGCTHTQTCTQIGRQAGRHRCVPHTVQLTFITHRFAYICVSCNNSNNKACLQLSAQCSSCINCKPVSVRVCVWVRVCVHVSCIICHAARPAALWLAPTSSGARLLCAPRLLKFDFCTQNCCLLLGLPLAISISLTLLSLAG